jgi:hypothetical protein
MAIGALLVPLVLLAGTTPPASSPAIPLPPPPVGTRFKAGPPGAKGKITRIGVPDPNVLGDVSPRELAVLSQALVTEVRKLEGIGAIGMVEIRAMLAQEYRREMLGCAVDEQCLAEIAGALGVDELVSSQLVVQEGTTTFTVSRIDMRTAKVAHSTQKRLTRRKSGEESLGAVGEIVETLYPDRVLKAGEVRGVSAEVSRVLNPPPLPRWVFFGTVGAAAVFAAGGTAYAVASNSTRADYNDLVNGGSSLNGAEMVRLENQADAQRARATLLFGIAGGLAIAAGVEAFFTDWHNDRAAVRVGPNGASVSVAF